MTEGVVNEVPEISGQAPFTMAFAAEIVDSRLSWGEKGLLWWLRFRCGTNGNTWISWDTVAEDLGESKRSVLRRAQKLKDLGWIVCSSRGFARSERKILSAPSKMYDPVLMSPGLYNKIRGDRTPEDVAILRSDVPTSSESEGSEAEDSSIGDRIVTCKEPHVKNDPLMTELSPHWCQNCHHSGDKIVTTEVNIINDIKQELDESVSYANREGPVDPLAGRDISMTTEGDLYYQDTGELVEEPLTNTVIAKDSSNIPKPRPDHFINNSEKKSENPKIDGTDVQGSTRQSEIEDDRMKKLIDSERSAAARGAKAVKAKRDKAKNRKAVREQSGESERIAKIKKATKADRQTIASKLAEHCEEKFRVVFPDIRQAWWSVGARDKSDQVSLAAGKSPVKLRAKNFKIAIDLLTAYEGDLELVKKAWDFSCDNWDELQAEFKLKEHYPTIGWLSAFRDRIFPRIQHGVSKREESESEQNKGTFGW